MLILFWRICYIIGLIFIVVNGPILKNILTIWSHCADERCERIFVDWCRPDSAKRRGMPIWWPLSRAEQRFLRKKELRKMGLIGSHFTGPNCFRELFSNLVLIKFGKLSRIRYDQCDQIGQFHAIWATFLKPSCTFIWPKLLGNFKRFNIFHFSSENCFGNFSATFYRRWATFKSNNLVTLIATTEKIIKIWREKNVNNDKCWRCHFSTFFVARIFFANSGTKKWEETRAF